jgi:hypothetical protein
LIYKEQANKWETSNWPIKIWQSAFAGSIIHI